VIVFRLADMRPESVNRHLEQVLRQAQNDLAQGAIISVREGQIRVRTLPI
jgi:predicted nuclease of predicted toxin-antitoxin system